MDVVNYDTVEFTLAVQDEGNEKFTYAGGGFGSALVWLSQWTGSYHSRIPTSSTPSIRSRPRQTPGDATICRAWRPSARLMDQEAEIA